MGYDQYVQIRLRAENFKLEIQEAKLACGKFYATSNKDKEIASSEIKKISVDTGQKAEINACGRYAARKGTEGYIQIMDSENERVLGKYKWDCPYWASKNSSKWEIDPGFLEKEFKENYQVKFIPGKAKGGPIGDVTLLIIKNN